MQLSELPEILKQHQLWLNSGGKEGKRAVLNGADFGDADLTDANFQRAELLGANFGKATLRRTNLREADLQNADLQEANFLLSTQLAGADVAGAKLPEAIADFEGLKIIAEATSNAQKLFIAMLGGCLYCWLTTGTTKDAALLTNSASSALPVIGTALPIVGFYLVAPVVLIALYFYFHLNMQRIWEGLADLPAVFPDGRPLDKVADPWLVNGLVRGHFFRLRHERPPLSRMQQWLSVLLAWCVIPVTLFVFWGRFLLRHDLSGTALHVGLLTASIAGGSMFYRLARATLRGAPRKRFEWTQAWKDGRTYKRIAGLSGACFFWIMFFLFSVKAIKGVSRSDGSFNVLRLAIRSLEDIGFRPFADVGRQDVSTKPSNWTGDVKEYPLVKGANLPLANLQHANAYLAFLVNADMREAKLSHANLSHAKLSNADLSEADLSHAYLSDADLSNADLTRANLSQAQLNYADLSKARLRSVRGSNPQLFGARLSDADLSAANLFGAELFGADLSGADLSDAKLSKADLKQANLLKTKLHAADLPNANLSYANFSDADLSMTDLSNANLLGANLSHANLSDTDLLNANLSNADLDDADLEGVDLRDAQGLTKSQLKKANTDDHTLLPADLPP